MGDPEYGLPSILYSVLNPVEVKSATTGKIKTAPHVFSGAVMTGGVGNNTTLTISLILHKPGPVDPCGMLPHAALSTYLTWTV